MKLLFFNIFFYSYLILFSAVYIPVFTIVLVVTSAFVPHSRVLSMLRVFIRWYGIYVIRVIPFPLIKIKYRDRDIEEKGEKEAAILICNHRSGSDPFLMACLRNNKIVQVVNTWPFKIPALGVIAKLAEYLDINGMPFNEFSEKSAALIKQGVSIAVFPEGTRSGNNEMGQFHGAIFRVALQVKCPIVPVCISGNENIPSKNFIMRPGTIKIHKLPAIKWKEYSGMGSFKLKNHVREIISRELTVMDKKDCN